MCRIGAGVGKLAADPVAVGGRSAHAVKQLGVGKAMATESRGGGVRVGEEPIPLNGGSVDGHSS